MSTPLPDFPTTPSDVPDGVPFEDLVDAHARHLFAAVVGAEPGGEAVPPAEVARHGLAALALAVSLVRGLGTDRWAAVRAALSSGATLAQVSAALDEPAEQVTAGLTAWADQRVTTGAISAWDYVDVLALADDATNATPAETEREQLRADLAGRLVAEQAAVRAADAAGGIFLPAADARRLREDAEHAAGRPNPGRLAEWLAGRVLDVLGRVGGAR